MPAPNLPPKNVFDHIPSDLPHELFTTLLKSPTCTIERIVSRGHRSADDDWYDQDHDEWVLLVQGGAEMAFKDRPDTVHLRPGDHLLLPAHCVHRVASTRLDQDTVWIAVRLPPGASDVASV